MWDIKLNTRLRVVQRLLVVQDANFDDLCVSERCAIAEERAATVTAEMRRDAVTGVVTLFRDGLRVAGDLEALAWDDDVRGVGGAGDLAAI